MKRFTTLTGWLVMAAAFIAGMTSCSKVDDIIDEPTPTTTDAPKTYTLTVTASKGGDDATTRALSLDGKTLNATWAEGEEIRVMKRRVMLGNVDYALLGTLSATTVSADGLNATFTGSLDADKVSSAGGLAEGDLLVLGYPGTHLGASTSAFVFNYNGQDGTLSTLSSNYDYCMTTTSKNEMVAVESVDEVTGAVTTSGTVSFTNQQAIVRFTLVGSDGTTPIKPISLEISAVGLVQSVALPESGTGISPIPTETTLTLTPDGSTNVIYAALRGISGQTVTLRAINDDDDLYTYTTATTVTFEQGKFYDIKVKMADGYNTVNLASLTGDYTTPDGYTILTGTLSGGHKISIANGATVKLRDVTIAGANDDSKPWAGITCLGDATIRLSGTNSVKGYNHYYPGIQAGGSGTTLTIEGSGKLTATCGGGDTGNNCAGIGGGREQEVGNIVIKDGDITAYGGTGAGIGSGYANSAPASCGNITVSGGTVRATSNSSGAGIGSGSGYEDYPSSCGNITISGGTVTATGGVGSAGIGSGLCRSGSGGSRCGDISITGGAITATGGISTAGSFIRGAAGIGTGVQAHCGNITISGTAKGTATHGENNLNTCYDIGTGCNGICNGTVSVAPGTISGTYPQ